jgi:hypothetical protein
LAISLLDKFISRDKPKGGRVDAISQSGGSRTVIKNMT